MNKNEQVNFELDFDNLLDVINPVIEAEELENEKRVTVEELNELDQKPIVEIVKPTYQHQDAVPKELIAEYENSVDPGDVVNPVEVDKDNNNLDGVEIKKAIKNAKTNFGSLGEIQYNAGTLRGFKSNIDDLAKQLKTNYKDCLKLVVNDEVSYNDVKKLKAQLNKEFKQNDEDRKNLKKVFTKPLEELDSRFKDKVTKLKDKYEAHLKAEIDNYDAIKFKEFYDTLNEHVLENRGHLTFLTVDDILPLKSIKKGDLTKLSQYVENFEELKIKVNLDLEKVIFTEIYYLFYPIYISNGYDFDNAIKEVRSLLQKHTDADSILKHYYGSRVNATIETIETKTDGLCYMNLNALSKLKLNGFLSLECKLNNCTKQDFDFVKDANLLAGVKTKLEK